MNVEPADGLLLQLLERGVISRADAVNGDVISLSERTRGWFRFLVHPQRQQFFVRQGPLRTREVALLASPSLAMFVPQIRIDDGEGDLAVYEVAGGAYDVLEFHRISRRFADWFPALLGQALATVHATPVTDPAFPRGVPPALTPSALQSMPVGQSIARIAMQWKPSALIHGDVDFERVMLAPEPERRITLIGWDDARIGDPAWDIGAVFEFFYAWSLDPLIVKDLEQSACPLPVPAMRAALTSFWSAYAAASRIASQELLVRAFAYAGVRMMARVERTLRKAEPVTPGLTQMMQAGLALMTAPAQAVTAFFAPPRPQWPQAQWGQW